MDLLPLDYTAESLSTAIAHGIVDGIAIGVLFVVLALMRLRS